VARPVDTRPNFAAYLLSFTMLGTFWLAQHTLLGLCTRSDRNLSWLHVGYLFVVTLLPFSATVLADYVTVPLAVGVYWLNIFLLGIALAASSGYSARAELVSKPDLARLLIFRRRILIAQLGYGLTALICLLKTYASVAALAAVQLYIIISPHIPRPGPTPATWRLRTRGHRARWRRPVTGHRSRHGTPHEGCSGAGRGAGRWVSSRSLRRVRDRPGAFVAPTMWPPGDGTRPCGECAGCRS